MFAVNRFIKNHFLIISILLISTLLKLPLIWDSYPIPINLDEPYLINSGLRVLNNFFLYKSLDPEFYTWGSFPIYISALLSSFLIFFKFIFFNPENLSIEALSYSIERIDFYVINRFFNLLLMNISVLTIYIFCKKNFNFFIAILSSIIVVMSPAYMHLSSIATTEHWNVLFSSLIIFFSFEIYKNVSNLKYVILYGLVLGVSVATKYYNFLFVVPLMTIFFLKILEKKYLYKQVILVGVISITTFFICMPYSLLNFEGFITTLQAISDEYTRGHAGAESDYNHSYLLIAKSLFSLNFGNPLLAMLFLMSFYFFYFKKKEYLIFIFFPLIYCAFIGAYNVFYGRSIISLIPYVAIASSILIYNYYLFIKNKKFKYILLLFLILTFFPTLNLNYIKIKDSFIVDTRYISLTWVKKNISPKDVIVAGHYSPPVWSLENFDNANRFWFLHQTNNEISSKKINNYVKYVILSSQAYKRYFNIDGTINDKYPVRGKLYKDFFDQNKLFKRFKPEQNKSKGPEIRIYLNKFYKG
ncbi:glycosyltransferase family 39 protein [Candidatus Pelagibacter sp.]|nr:glycosyltransferase family 39 protein [Candidatus Pelagibacter sp.]